MENNANVEMTGAENLENTNQETQTLDTSLENQTQSEQQPSQAEIATAYLKEQGFEFDTIEDLKKAPEVREVNPYEDVLDEDDKAYLNFKKQTGRTRKEYESLSVNLDELPKIDLARERVRKETGLKNLSNEEADEYITDTLGIDLEDMSGTDQIKLAKFTKDLIEEKKAEQEKFKQPKENKPNAQAPNEYVKLPNGSVMLKADVEAMEITRQENIKVATEALNSVTASDFKVTFDDNGTNREESYSYEYSEQDKHSMLSNVSNLEGVMEKEYRSEKGFDHKQFGEDMFWRNKNNREKAIASIVHKAVAKNTEAILKLRGNVNYDSTKPLQTTNNNGGKVKTFDSIFNG